MATLCKETGVDQAKFPLALKALVESMGVDVKPNTLMKLVQLPMLAEAQEEPEVKKVDAAVRLQKRTAPVNACKAKSHPCVCKDSVLTAVDQPMSYCKAKVTSAFALRFNPVHILRGIRARECILRTSVGCWRGYVRGRRMLPAQRRIDDDDVIEILDGRQAQEEEVAQGLGPSTHESGCGGGVAARRRPHDFDDE